MKVINKGKSNIKVLLKDGSKGVLASGYALDLDEKIAESLIKMYPGEVYDMDSLLVSPEKQSLKQQLAEKTAEIERLKAKLSKKEAKEESIKVSSQEDKDLEALKKEADEMGLTYSPNIGLKKLKEKVEEAKKNQGKVE